MSSLYAALFQLAPADGAALGAVAADFSPRFERFRDDLVAIDISGLGRLLGEPPAIGAELRQALATRGIRAHVAIAGTPTAAILLAVARAGVTVVPSGGEAEALAPLPVGLLARVASAVMVSSGTRAHTSSGAGASANAGLLANAAASRKIPRRDRLRDPQAWVGQALEALRAWGIRTLGEFAALPAADVVARLGRYALDWQAVARGEAVRPLVPTLEDERFASTIELDWPIEGLEPLSFVLTRLLEPLSTRLEQRDRGAAVLHVILGLVTHALSTTPDTWARRLELPTPMRDVRALRTLALLDLESHPPEAAIESVTVVIDPTPGRILQHTLFTRPLPTPEQLSTLLARLGAVMGQDRVGAPARVDSHRPGAFAMTPFSAVQEARDAAPAPMSAGHRAGGMVHVGVGAGAGAAPGAPATALRRCRQPVPARVQVEQGEPVRVTTDRKGFAGGHVLHCAGPWRTSGAWWLAPSEANHVARVEGLAPSEARGSGRVEGNVNGGSEAPPPQAPPLVSADAVMKADTRRGHEPGEEGVGRRAAVVAAGHAASQAPAQSADGSAAGLAMLQATAAQAHPPRDSRLVSGAGMRHAREEGTRRRQELQEARQPHASEPHARGMRGSDGAATDSTPPPVSVRHDTHWDRDEWDVSLSDGAVYRLFRNRVTDRWFIDAIVD